MTEPEIELSLTRALAQDQRWVDGQLIEEMDWKHRANLIPFLRRNAEALYWSAFFDYNRSSLALVEDPSEGVAAAQAQAEAPFYLEPEDWLEQTPLMQKLVSYEQGRPFAERAFLHATNKAYEVATGYNKIVLVPGRRKRKRRQ